jgi:hypothetical protein
MTDVRCKNCQAVIDPANIDWERELASCARCGRLMDLRRERAAAPEKASPEPGKPRVRIPVDLPVGMSVASVAGERLVIRRRWLRQKHWFMLFLFVAAALYVGYLWATIGANAWLVIGTLFVLSWNYNLVAMFVNSTIVTADADKVTVRHGPIPSLFGRNRSLEKRSIEQLYAATYGALFAVQAKLKGGHTLTLVAPLVTADQALFIEQELERALGLVDMAIAGELGSEGVSLAGKRPAGASSGAFLTLAVPLLIAGIAMLFFITASTEVTGRLQASGALGSWVFEPDDCVSGQREGFGGVVLTASKQPERVVRVVKDPVRGELVVVAAPGKPNHVLSGNSCSRLDASAERTNTSYNDIWLVNGKMTLECNDLSGSVTFEGCH